MDKPLVSVIVPCYNMEQYVVRAVDSLLANDYERKQIILVNDGSTDGTLAVLRAYAVEQPCVVVVDKCNGGVSSARNAGLDVAEGDYVMFADPDDEMSSDFIATAVSAITSGNGYDVVMFGFRDGEGHEFSPKPFALDTKNEVLEQFFPAFFSYTRDDVEHWLGGVRLRGKPGGQIWRFILKRTIISQYYLRFSPHLVAGEDQMFLSLFLLYAKSFKSISDVLYTYYIRTDGAYMSNIRATNPEKTLQNKVSLLEERRRIAGLYKEKIHVQDGQALYMGSIVLSCFQLAVLYSKQIYARKFFFTYVNLPEVRECCGKVKFSKQGGVRKWLPMYLLQHKMYGCLYWLIWVATKCKIKFTI